MGQGVMNAANFVMQNSPEKDEEETTESLFDRRIRLEKEEEGRPPRERRRSSSMQKAQDRRQMMFEDADMESVLREAKEDMFLKGEAPLIATTTTQLGTMGVGIQLSLDKATKELVVVSPIDGTPASRAGVLSKDVIVTIDGTPTKGMSTEDAVKLIRGPEGSEVVLGLRRGNQILAIPYL